jgi:hypothetical protein
VIRAASHGQQLRTYGRSNKLACIHQTRDSVTGQGRIAYAVEKDDRVDVRSEQARRE